jgi:hypothetical protein
MSRLESMASCNSVGVPDTVTASLKPSDSVTVSPTCSVPVPGEAVACVTAGKIGSIWRPENVFTAPERFAARPDEARDPAKLQIEGRARDLAMFNLAIDSKLRGCDVVAIGVKDVAAGGYTADRATVGQRKTGGLSDLNSASRPA